MSHHNNNLADIQANNNLVVFVTTDNEETSYRTVNMMYSAVFLSQFGLSVYLLDIEGDSSRLTNPSRSVSLDIIDQVDLTNDDKKFVILVTPTSQENLDKLFAAFHIPNKFSMAELQSASLGSVTSGQEPYRSLLRRAYGNGAQVHFVYYLENVFDMGENFSDIQEFANYNFSGYILRGPANQAYFNILSSSTRAAELPQQLIYPTIVSYIRNDIPKKLSICYLNTLLRFMALENIQYFIRMEDPELADLIEWKDITNVNLEQASRLLEESFAFICLDMAQEYSILMPEAMYTGNMVLGFGGTFDVEAGVNGLTDFSPELNYRDVAEKVMKYARIYRDELKSNPNYRHPIAQAASEFAGVNFTNLSLFNNFLSLLRKLGFNINQN